MSNPGQAQEPTMEEILASIRRIISEDSGAEEPAQAAEAAAPPPPAPEPAYIDEPEPAPQPEEDDILELTEALPEEPAPAPTYAPEPDFADDIDFAPESTPEPEPEPVYEAAPEPEPVPAVAPIMAAGIAPQPQPALADEPDTDFEEPVMSPDPAPSKASPLLSSETETAASAAFGALANTLMSSSGGGSRTLEDIVADMLRPMLKEWLDDNLPALVERLVAEEIERVSRRKR